MRLRRLLRRRLIWRRRWRTSASRWLRRDYRRVLVFVCSLKPVYGESVDSSAAVQFECLVSAFHDAEGPGIRTGQRRLMSVASDEDELGVGEVCRNEIRLTSVSRSWDGA